MTRDELGLWLRLSAADGIGSLTATKLLKQFGLPHNIFAQDEQTLCKGIHAKQARALLESNPQLPALIEATWQWLESASGGVMLCSPKRTPAKHARRR